jgi:dihydrofolate reductase
MRLTAIVAVSQNGYIGKDGGLPWHLPAEMAFFKRTTTDHPIIMGRKTYESIGRPLPERKNIIISRDNMYEAEGCLVVSSLEEALEAARGSDEVFIIGGASIYQLAMPKIDKIYLTRVKTDVQGDKRFEFDESGWKMVSNEPHPADAENEYAFDIQEWARK